MKNQSGHALKQNPVTAQRFGAVQSYENASVVGSFRALCVA